jgi:quinolinate synthase
MQVASLAQLLSSKRIGVVAHFYMDPQVQGVLTSAAALWPHINISDSLVMADAAVKMAEAGCRCEGAVGHGREPGDLLKYLTWQIDRA